MGWGAEVLFWSFSSSRGRGLTRNWKVGFLVRWATEILQPWAFLKNVHGLELES